MPSRLEFTQHAIPEFGDVLLLNGSIEQGAADRFAAHLTATPTLPNSSP